jgi:hypothetical protein
MKEYMQTLEEDHTSCRTSYRKAMKNLEDLSNSIHRKRSSSTVNRNSFIEDVDTVELEAAVAGLHLGGEMRDSDEYIHYNPGEVDSLSASSLSQEGDFTVQSDSENLVEGLMPLVEEEDCKAHPLSKVHSDSMLVPRLDNEGQPIVRTDNRDSQVPGEDHQVVAKHKEDVQQLTEEDKLDQPKFVVSVNDQPVSAEDGDHPVSGDVRDNHPVSGEDQDVQPASEEDRDGQLVSGNQCLERIEISQCLKRIETRQCLERMETSQCLERIGTRQCLERIETRQSLKRIETTSQCLERIETSQCLERMETSQCLERIGTRQCLERIETRQSLKRIETTSQCLERIETSQCLERIEISQCLKRIETRQCLERIETKQSLKRIEMASQCLERIETTRESLERLVVMNLTQPHVSNSLVLWTVRAQ